jgi:hypothetical protein
LLKRDLRLPEERLLLELALAIRLGSKKEEGPPKKGPPSPTA